MVRSPATLPTWPILTAATRVLLAPRLALTPRTSHMLARRGGRVRSCVCACVRVCACAAQADGVAGDPARGSGPPAAAAATPEVCHTQRSVLFPLFPFVSRVLFVVLPTFCRVLVAAVAVSPRWQRPRYVCAVFFLLFSSFVPSVPAAVRTQRSVLFPLFPFVSRVLFVVCFVCSFFVIHHSGAGSLRMKVDRSQMPCLPALPCLALSVLLLRYAFAQRKCSSRSHPRRGQTIPMLRYGLS